MFNSEYKIQARMEEEIELREKVLKKKIGLAKEILTDWKILMMETAEDKDNIEKENKWMIDLVEKIGGETDLDVKERDEFIEKTIQTRKEGIRLMTEGTCNEKEKEEFADKMMHLMKENIRLKEKITVIENKKWRRKKRK